MGDRLLGGDGGMDSGGWGVCGDGVLVSRWQLIVLVVCMHDSIMWWMDTRGGDGEIYIVYRLVMGVWCV